MQLTRESEYALLGMAFLAARPPGKLVPLAEVAAAQRLPPSFLAKIFQKLARHGLLTVERGRGSGYALARPAGAIAVGEILEAVEGQGVMQRCLLWQGHCADANPCPLHFRVKAIRPTLESLLKSVTLADYVRRSGHYRRATALAAGSR